MPPERAVGRIEWSNSLPSRPHKEFVILSPREFADTTAFKAAVDSALSIRADEEQTILLFIHGYNTDLTSAILRMARFIHDTEFGGVPVDFSWASRGEVFDYVYDINSALHAWDGILDIGAALTETHAKGYDILAYSMGNSLTMEAIRQASIIGRHGRNGKMKHVVLASADIDIDLFREQLRHVPVHKPPIFVLISDDDNVDGMNHTKFVQSPEVVKLIGTGLRTSGQMAIPPPRVFPGSVLMLSAK